MRFLFSKIPHKVIIQNFFLWLISLLIVILSFQSDASNIWVTLSLVGLIALSVDNEFIFFPCFFECLPSFVEYQIHACSVAQTSLILWDTMDCGPPGSSVHGIPRQEHWRGLPFPSLGIFLTQGSSPRLLHCRQILYHLSHQKYSIYTHSKGSYFNVLATLLYECDF